MKMDYGWRKGGNGSNSSGFSGLPGGTRLLLGPFIYGGSVGIWWSSSLSDSFVPVEDEEWRTEVGGAWFRALGADNEQGVLREHASWRDGGSVRCVRSAK